MTHRIIKELSSQRLEGEEITTAQNQSPPTGLKNALPHDKYRKLSHKINHIGPEQEAFATPPPLHAEI